MLVCALMPALACSDARPSFDERTFALGEGRFRLDFQDGARPAPLVRDTTTLLTLDALAFQVGVVDELTSDRSWDPGEIERRGDAD